jgi:hypothetical protein
MEWLHQHHILRLEVGVDDLKLSEMTNNAAHTQYISGTKLSELRWAGSLNDRKQEESEVGSRC